MEPHHNVAIRLIQLSRRRLHLSLTSPTRTFSATASTMGSTAASLPPPDLVNKGVSNAPFYLPETTPSAGTAMSSKLFSHNETLPLLYQPIEIGGMTFKNRIQVAPVGLSRSEIPLLPEQVLRGRRGNLC